MATKRETATARKPASRRRKPPEAQVIRITKPDIDTFDGKALVRLAQSDILMSNLQIVKEGGDNNLHSHAGMDGLWFVLKGRARFYGTEDDVLIAELGPHEAVFIPRGYPYWFETASDEPLEILQVEALDRSVRNVRTNHKPMPETIAQTKMFSLDGAVIQRGPTSTGEEKG